MNIGVVVVRFTGETGRDPASFRSFSSIALLTTDNTDFAACIPDLSPKHSLYLRAQNNIGRDYSYNFCMGVKLCAGPLGDFILDKSYVGRSRDRLQIIFYKSLQHLLSSNQIRTLTPISSNAMAFRLVI